MILLSAHIWPYVPITYDIIDDGQMKLIVYSVDRIELPSFYDVLSLFYQGNMFKTVLYLHLD